MLVSSNGNPGFVEDIDWEHLPDGMHHLDVVSLQVDADGRVFALARKDPRLITFSRSGEFLGSWGEGTWSDRPHSLTISPDGCRFYVVDELRHRVMVHEPSGRLIMTIGSGLPSATGHQPDVSPIADRLRTIERSAGPFNLPTKLAVGANGDLYVADGYGNARIHRFDTTGLFKGSWGEPGCGLGEFILPHDILALADGRLLVADRENDRIQVFDLDGQFVEEWAGIQRPSAICLDKNGNVLVAEMMWLVGERSPRNEVVSETKVAGLRVLNLEGETVMHWRENGDGLSRGQILAPHAVAVDIDGSIYLGEVSHTFATVRGLDPGRYQSLRKLRPLD